MKRTACGVLFCILLAGCVHREIVTVAPLTPAEEQVKYTTPPEYPGMVLVPKVMWLRIVEKLAADKARSEALWDENGDGQP